MNELSLGAQPTQSRFRILSTVIRHHFSPYKTYIHRPSRIAILLNPKVGTTSFRRILVEGMQETGMRPNHGRFFPINQMRRYLTPTVRDYASVILHPNQYHFYCFVRNPYARLLSAWKNKILGGHTSGEYPRSMIPLVPKIRKFCARHGLEGSAPDTLIPFTAFITYVAAGREGHRNQHWDTQCSVLFTDRIHYEHAFRMETEFNTGVLDLLTRIGLPDAWIRQKLASPQNTSSDLDKPAYTTELAEKAYAIYRSDFDQFGYDVDSWNGL